MGDDIREEGTVGGGREEGLREDGWTEWGMISERKGLSGEEVYYRATRRRISSNIDPT